MEGAWRKCGEGAEVGGARAKHRQNRGFARHRAPETGPLTRAPKTEPRMIYRFDECELDTDRAELLRSGVEESIEPQVYALLLLLIENQHRLVTKDEIIASVWDGRAVSDSALTSRIKSARRAIGDDGKTQRLVRTVHGKGFRFTGEAVPALKTRAEATGTEGQGRGPAEERAGRRIEVTPSIAEPDARGLSSRGPFEGKPSIAVLPFGFVGKDASQSTVSEALAHELIVELSRLRWLFVIARGSSFRFRANNPDTHEVGRILGVRYCLAGALEVAENRFTVRVELIDTELDTIVWADRVDSALDGIHEVRAQLVSNIVAALELQIPLHEAQNARLVAPDNLDAWSAYHVGLQHMFRFNHADNAVAARMFERAIAQDPGFARAHAGLSFTYFQNAFVHYTAEPGRDRDQCRHHAERSVDLDPIDPFANFTMGRVYWLDGDLGTSLEWLDRSTSISPNYAQGIYARAWTETLAGNAQEGEERIGLALALSPLDPLRFGMLGTLALTHLIRGDDVGASGWAEKAARAPNSHVMLAMIAVATHQLAGNGAEARAWTEAVRSRNPRVDQVGFFRSFPFQDEGVRARLAGAFTELGF